MKFEKSKELYEKAINLMPSGVSSPVRAVKPFPFYTSKAKGSKIYDVDGNEFIDYCLAYGPLILGHANEEVKKAVEHQLEKGWLYGTPVELEVEYAELITKIFPSIDMVRFTNTGSEATMAALRLARGYTGRDKIVKIEGSFHGAHDAVLVKAGSGATTFSIPNSAGVPESFVENTLQVPYNDIESLSDVIEKNRESLAALILEPVMGNASLIKPEKDYLREVRKITKENDVLLIFDEVITGFRLSLGGAQQYYNIKADITTLGKIAGGGFPIGIIGGRKDIMENFAPSGNVYQAGTFSGNPISLTAGITTVRILKKMDPYDELERKMRMIVESLKDYGCEIDGIASIFCIYFGEKPRNYADALRLDKETYLRFYWRLLEKGVFIPPSQYEVCFISVAHSDEDISRSVDAMIECLKEL